MENIKEIVAKNITDLRTALGFTQLQLAEALNYSDKSISKWERAKALPDVEVLLKMSEIFGVTIDYFVRPEHKEEERKKEIISEKKNRQHIVITGMSIILVWLLATCSFVFVDIFSMASAHWISFVYAVPVSLVVWLVFNTLWFNKRRNYIIISALMWSLLACIYINCFIYGFNLWLIFTIGIPGQIIIIFWSKLKKS